MIRLSAPAKSFDVEIAFQSSFHYVGGDLLLDIRIQNCQDPGVFFDRDNVSSVTRTMVADDIDATIQNLGSGGGLVRQFRCDALFQDRFEDAS